MWKIGLRSTGVLSFSRSEIWNRKHRSIGLAVVTARKAEMLNMNSGRLVYVVVQVWSCRHFYCFFPHPTPAPPHSPRIETRASHTYIECANKCSCYWTISLVLLLPFSQWSRNQDLLFTEKSRQEDLKRKAKDTYIEVLRTYLKFSNLSL